MRRTLATSMALALLTGACATGPKTEAEMRADPQYTRATFVALDHRLVYERIATYARKCWDDSEMTEAERRNRAIGPVVTFIFAGPLAGASATGFSKRTEASYDPVQKVGIVRKYMTAAGSTGAPTVTEVRAKDGGAEVRTYARVLVDRLHAIPLRWANDEKTCKDVSDRQIQ